MISNEELLREIARLKAENEVLRSQPQIATRDTRKSYDHGKLVQIPEFENVFWQKGENGNVYLINRYWVSVLGEIIRALLFPQYTKISNVRNKYACCMDLNEDEYLKYLDLMDYILGYLAAQAYTWRVKEANA